MWTGCFSRAQCYCCSRYDALCDASGGFPAVSACTIERLIETAKFGEGAAESEQNQLANRICRAQHCRAALIAL